MKRSRLSYDEWQCIISKVIFGQYWNIKEEIEKPDFVINNLTELCNLL